MHDGQLAVPVATARTLVAEQFPAWRGLTVRAVPSPGTVNAIFRIGDRLAARFPLVAAEQQKVRAELEVEAAAGRELAGRTRFATPEPVALGEPGAGYPLPWSVQTWLPGVTATTADPARSVPFAGDLGGLGPADPALDLVAGWHLLADEPREAFRAALAGASQNSGDREWARGQAWAFQQAMGLVWYYRDTNPPMAALGRRTLDRILAATARSGPG
jgi:aminoglycoside phosphotransferase (APT) family kinase protein